MGEEGFTHGITPEQIKRIRELEKENKALKEIVIQKELEGKLKDELLKKKFALEKKGTHKPLCFSRLEARCFIINSKSYQTPILL